MKNKKTFALLLPMLGVERALHHGAIANCLTPLQRTEPMLVTLMKLQASQAPQPAQIARSV
jgi:hypothetical protein